MEALGIKMIEYVGAVLKLASTWVPSGEVGLFELLIEPGVARGKDEGEVGHFRSSVHGPSLAWV